MSFSAKKPGRVYPSPPGEIMSTAYKVSVSGQRVLVFEAKVAPSDEQLRWKAMDDKKKSADYFDMGAFAFLIYRVQG